MRRLVGELGQDRVLRISAGDLLCSHPAVVPEKQRAPWQKRSEKLIALLNACRFDVIALGDADLGLGVGFLARAFSNFDGTLVCSNLPKFGTLVPNTITRRGDIVIGIFALLKQPATSLSHSLSQIALLIEVATRQTTELRSNGAEFIVMLGHLGAKDDKYILSNVPGIDIAVAGCCPGPLNNPQRCGNAHYVSAMFGGGQLGRIDLRRTPSGGLSFSHQLIDMDAKIPPDRWVQDQVRAAELSLRGNRHTSTIRSGSHSSSKKIMRVFNGREHCATCHPQQADAWKSTPHARAYRSLPTPNQHQGECLDCHTTGFGEATFRLPHGNNGLEAVQCEACHYTSPQHPRKKARLVNTPVDACLRCHTPVRSPGFSPHKDWKRAACPKTIVVPSAG